jgi:hypothetical protein
LAPENGFEAMKPEDLSARGPIRRSPIAGTWYPLEPERLEQEVRDHLALAAPPSPLSRLIGLLSPHAGLRYSGPVAAWGYRLLDRFAFDSAILVGPSHFLPFVGASLYAEGAFETPLGLAKVDQELAEALLGGSNLIRYQPEAHEGEHSLEMQLPFLQLVLPRATIVPLLMGAQSPSTVEEIAVALSGVVAAQSRRVLLVASSDLSHYHSAEVAAKLDSQVVERIERFDPEGLMGLLARRREHACGGGPLAAVMLAARGLGAGSGLALRYGDSGDVSGDKTQVVGYLSAAFFAGAA